MLGTVVSAVDMIVNSLCFLVLSGLLLMWKSEGCKRRGVLYTNPSPFGHVQLLAYS